jgi:hypothetical protein
MNGNKKYYQAKFSPKNPEKYQGDPTNIIGRSGWELKLCKWLDENKDVVEWASEEIIVYYQCVTDGNIHRYFPDFYIKFRNGKKYLIEVKPHKETQEPRMRKKATKRFIQEVMTYGKNISKWKAAKEFAEERGWTFLVWTEHELSKLGIRVTV